MITSGLLLRLRSLQASSLSAVPGSKPPSDSSKQSKSPDLSHLACLLVGLRHEEEVVFVDSAGFDLLSVPLVWDVHSNILMAYRSWRHVGCHGRVEPVHIGRPAWVEIHPHVGVPPVLLDDKLPEDRAGWFPRLFRCKVRRVVEIGFPVGLLVWGVVATAMFWPRGPGLSY